jgi:dolichol-phosphate mannosyltransferase
VDDGSTDGTAQICADLHRQDPRFQFVSLSRNFGHQRALTAGLDFCTGQAVAAMDADLQDPPEVVLEMISRWKDGVDVVYGQRRSRQGETAFKKATAAADFRLMDRVVVDTLSQLREQGRFMRGLVHWVGFRQEALLYDRHARAAGSTKYPLVKMLRFAWDGITSFSTMPLRLATWCGFAVFVASALLIVFYFFRKVVFHDDLVPGWTALIMAVLAFGGLQMFFIGLLGEYVGRCFSEVKGRPLYLVKATSLISPPDRSK